jgi:hypothetical protein
MHDAMPPEEIAKWDRWFGIDCNNRAWRLSEQRLRSPEENEEMLHSAHAAALHWGKIGTDLHRARAEMLLGHVYALLGDGSNAMRYARRSFDFVAGRDSPAWEIAFAHAVLCNAAAAAGDSALHARHHERAKTLAAALEDAEDREIFDATFRVIPAPARL